ncbi:MAG: hypothetical protein KJ583_02865 [Nanoarchaeota archaeon]|nr:hypothetical protein [Nanoarchaeota archaeon]MBU1270036.1 hypothetical protein [Nanoarchaeota archaeon]MBU1604236.1 hypothetical protein [Nanoarchaeota archaeon]MBU2443772.1 hypothetical protein [Nanoarchaeota archaeon]
MNKKVFSVLILTMFLMTIFSSVVVAQTGNIGEDMFGDKGIFSGIVTGLAKFINQLATIQFTMPIKWPGIDSQQTNMLTLILVFIVLFALVYPAAGYIPLFKSGESTGTRKAFSVALALLIAFFSPIPIILTTVMLSYMSSLLQIGLVVLLILGFWWMVRGTGFGIAKVNQLGAKATTLQNENRKVQRDVRMEEQMGRREDTALRQLANIERNAISIEGDIDAKWRSIQNELANMGALRTEQALQRGQQILNVIANLMGEESQEAEIQTHIERITSVLSKETIQEVAGLTRDKKLTDSIKKNMSLSTDEANRFIAKALADAREAANIIKRIETINAANLKYQSEVRRMSNEVGNLIRNARFKEAGSMIGKIRAEIQKEKSDDQQIEQLINKAIQLVRLEVTQLHRARK